VPRPKELLVPPSAVGPAATITHSHPERRLVLAAMAMTVLAEVVVLLLRHEAVLWFGNIPVSLSLIPSAVLLFAVGPRRLMGHRLWTERPLAFWFAGLVALAGSIAVYLTAWGSVVDVVGLVAVGLNEELVYRFAAPVVIAAGLARAGLWPDHARTIGYVIAGIWFVFLPGHVAQMHSLGAVFAYVAFATVLGVVVMRSGSVLAAALVHTIANLLTFGLWGGSIEPTSRALLLGSVLGLFVIAFGRRGRQVDDEGEVIDLREPVAPGRPDIVIDLRHRPLAPTRHAADDIVIDLREAERRP
jgi:hypothetical protein